MSSIADFDFFLLFDFFLTFDLLDEVEREAFSCEGAATAAAL